MAKAFRVWIDVEEFDTDVPDDGDAVPQDFGPTMTIVAVRDDPASVSRARDMAVGFAETLHERAAELVAS